MPLAVQRHQGFVDAIILLYLFILDCYRVGCQPVQEDADIICLGLRQKVKSSFPSQLLHELERLMTAANIRATHKGIFSLV